MLNPNLNSTTVHKVVAGKIHNGEIPNSKQIGTGLFIDSVDKKRFELSLWPFGLNKYFVVKNLTGGNYTIFAKLKDADCKCPKFCNPVGYGYIKPELKDYLQLQFNFPWQKVFLYLHPTF